MKDFFLYAAIVCVAGWVMLWVFFKPHIGFYYPYADDQTIFEQSEGSVGSFQDCRWWAYNMHQNRTNKNAMYSCGSKCTYNKEKEYYFCEDLTKPQLIDVL